MGVYIKGMKMPKRCVGCACYDRTRGDEIYTYDGCNALRMLFNENVSYGANIHDPFEGIYKDCPLVPVKTPHGRLIDADALVRRLNEIGAEPDYQHENEDWQVGLILAEDAIYDAPTVIEAEEG